MSILNRTRDLVVLNSDRTLLELSLDLRDMDRVEQRQRFGGHRKSGFVYLHSNETKHPGVVFECVASREGGDYISTIYRGHPIFNSLNALISARDALVDALAAKIGLSVEAIGIPDAARGRDLGIEDLATGQLVDLLLEQTRGVAVSPDLDNRGLGHADTEMDTSNPFKDAVIGRGDMREAGVLTVGPGGELTVQDI